jgi:N-carbamoyl-L-amino-acid hydrolase
MAFSTGSFEIPMIIDTAAFLKDLYDLRKIGEYKTGVSRPTYSPQDMESRRWLMDRMREVGLDASIDGIGNVFGRHRGTGPSALVGSHIESQIEAGWLDGALGVVAGLALARAGLSVDVCAFADEEAHFEGYLGSRSIVGDLSEEQIDQIRGRNDGPPLRTALQTAGLGGLPRMQIDPSRYKGFFEIHIEQGTQLENADKRIGVVSGIVAIWWWSIIFHGKQDHAGATTMHERRDAGLAAVRLLAAIDKEFPTICGEHSVWTAGQIALDPGAPGIIPGKAEVSFEFRDLSPDVLQRLENMLRALVQESNRNGKCRAELVNRMKSTPVNCDAAMMRALANAAEEMAPGHWQTMQSRAGHDAKIISKKLPVAMLFVPSIAGVSHHWLENTSDEDLSLGVEILAKGVEKFLDH